MHLEILCLQKQVNVRCTAVEPMKKETIEDIASKLGQRKRSCKSVEAVIYRRALREALNLLEPVAPSGVASPLKEREKLPIQKDTLEEAWLSLRTTQWLSPHKDPPERGKEQKISDTPIPCEVTAVQNESVFCSTSSLNHKSTWCGPSGDEEFTSQTCCVSKAERAGTSRKELQSSPRTCVERKSTCSSKEAVKCHPAAGSPSFHPLEISVSTSTPAVSPSCKSCSKSSLVSKKADMRPGPQKTLSASPTEGALVASEFSKERETPHRKYSRVSSGHQHPEGSNGTPTQNYAVLSPSLKRRRRLCLEDSKSGPAEGSVLEREREESQNMDGEQSDAEGDLESISDLSLQLSPVRESSLSPSLKDDSEEDELPSFLSSQELGSIEEGEVVWCKLRRYPYWPAVVRNLKRKAKKASVFFIDKYLEDKPRSFSVSLKNLKHFDCEEKKKLIDAARESYKHEIDWCINLIEDYWIRIGCSSFVGSFLEYCSDAMSYPVRKEGLNASQMNFPQIEEEEVQESHSELTPTRLVKKLLPDRTRAARNRANKKIVDFIIKAKGADEHLRSILKRQKPSQWLTKFLRPRQKLTYIETYLEDDSQQDQVYSYLKGMYQETDAEIVQHINGDSIRLILDVLFPEAIIYAISAVDQIDYKKAEEKYMRGPSVGHRERKLFEEQIMEEKRRKNL
ncbi:PWWP domain-containing DNA repair factor 3A isoform X2 [Sceloporus undulatus]|uniref:PWWP domain-containing DNA repair factor 3A isoform X2 n=1 Tax=Sceloporus undulatus TaxID=8520 RepID=UPI001C4CC2CD|nr:PWWP domain-containing DNA repair factor 3A isoform X2 [Sceloporus undulatus]